ncbi:fumarylacetoacetate hydrolase family protein [Streptomyces sp. NPDC091280]|uniref:fumarylacetoacetate hydrolase family protein n=1 Tax=Streptomyces sp. NPDC091280 TaxID=3365984 RepID=UPI00381849B6
MKPAATSVPFTGPFALGTLSAPDGVPFPAVVTPDGRALGLPTALSDEVLTIRTLLESLSYISQTSHLLPGDLVLTGSPAGNGMHWGRLLRDSDVMEGSITGLGVQRTRCVEEKA